MSNDTYFEQLDERRQMIIHQAQAIGLELWRRLAHCKHVGVTTTCSGGEFDEFFVNTFRGVFINGEQCALMHSAYHRLNVCRADLDGLVVWSIEPYAGVDDLYTRPVPREWRAKMGIADDVEVVHIHICGAVDPGTVYNATLAYLNGVDTLTRLRAEGVHVGYSAQQSLDPSLPL